MKINDINHEFIRLHVETGRQFPKVVGHLGWGREVERDATLDDVRDLRSKRLTDFGSDVVDLILQSLPDRLRKVILVLEDFLLVLDGLTHFSKQCLAVCLREAQASDAPLDVFELLLRKRGHSDIPSNAFSIALSAMSDWNERGLVPVRSLIF